MVDHMKAVLRGQFEAALAMFNDCLVKCAPEEWDSAVAKYSFWQVAYHTLCFVDCYLSPGNDEFAKEVARRAVARTNDVSLPDLHPLGMKELEDEYPSRRFTKDELFAYVTICRQRIETVLGDGPESEGGDSLQGPSGFGWLPFSRAELHLYNIRHVQHHTGQLSAVLRRAGAGGGEPRWVKSGWK
ncbi:MAG: DinB family protein [Phycisphaerales bacterium]|nr:DinB family protein [Phycisphaerales bacterium]